VYSFELFTAPLKPQLCKQIFDRVAIDYLSTAVIMPLSRPKETRSSCTAALLAHHMLPIPASAAPSLVPSKPAKVAIAQAKMIRSQHQSMY
jgi:hypothetical protein